MLRRARPVGRPIHGLVRLPAAPAPLALVLALIAPLPQASTRAAPSQAAADCVAIGIPKPATVYTYRHTESTGQTSQYSQQWERVTPTESRVRVLGPKGVEIQVNEHRIVNDAVVLDRTTKRSRTDVVLETTVFRPAIVLDPAFRACAGRSWAIPSVTATYGSAQGRASTATPAGTLRILGIRERVTVPAGTFDTIRYVRTSQSRDEYWKSIDHGVIVRHVGTLPTGVVTEELVSIK